MNERIRVGSETMSRLEARAVVESAARCCDELSADEVARLVRAAQRANRTLRREQRGLAEARNGDGAVEARHRGAGAT